MSTFFKQFNCQARERKRVGERDGGEGYDGDKTKPREAMAIAKREKKVKWKAELV